MGFVSVSETGEIEMVDFHLQASDAKCAPGLVGSVACSSLPAAVKVERNSFLRAVFSSALLLLCPFNASPRLVVTMQPANI